MGEGSNAIVGGDFPDRRCILPRVGLHHVRACARPLCRGELSEVRFDRLGRSGSSFGAVVARVT